MAEANLLEELAAYLKLARLELNRRNLSECDRLLAMAAVAAWLLELWPLARFCRQLVLNHNPGHRLGRTANVGAALLDPDFVLLWKQWVRRLSPDVVRTRLRELGLEVSAAPADCSDDAQKMLRYACAAFGIDADWLLESFGNR